MESRISITIGNVLTMLVGNVLTEPVGKVLDIYNFLDKGMDGGPGGGDEDSKIVYAYKKTSLTNP